MKLGAKQLREVGESQVRASLKKMKRNPLYFILENVYDTYNVGGLFRLADALAIERVYLCAEMETPPNHKIKKASVGTYKVVPWTYKSSAAEAIAELRKGQGERDKALHAFPLVIAVEQSPKAVDYRKIHYQFPLALVFGSETSGITKETLKLCDQIAEIPMWGINKSLNVIVSAAIVSYRAYAEGLISAG